MTMRTLPLAAAWLLAGSSVLLAGGYGTVDFANSGAPEAQADFLEGLAQLHDFEYAAAAESFRRAETADPGFAMAYWGEAMTFNHPIWMQQDLESGRAALAKLAPTAEGRRAKAPTEREKAYLDAIEILYGEGTKQDRDFRYRDAMAKLHERFPDDVDAAAFYGLSILGTAHAGRDIPAYMRAAGVLEEAWMDHREHPGLLHYLIHSYDDPAHAPLGLRQARIYARVAPRAAHAQHMTSHIFLALGMWPETVAANVAAIADVDRVREAKGVPKLGCGHYPSWLSYAYLQLGQEENARAAVERCRTELDQRAAEIGPGQAMDPDESLIGSLVNMRLRYLLDTGDWTGEIAGWPLPEHAGPGARLDFAFTQVLREIALGHAEEARGALADLEATAAEVEEIEKRQESPDPTYRLRAEIFVLEAKGLLAELDGDVEGAEQQLRRAVAQEESLPIAFGPPVIDKPTHEALGELLLRRGRIEEARAELQRALARTPGRRLAEQGLERSTPGASPESR
jgi:tetratricopeptide (TPR) repeat protein